MPDPGTPELTPELPRNHAEPCLTPEPPEPPEPEPVEAASLSGQSTPRDTRVHHETPELYLLFATP